MVEGTRDARRLDAGDTGIAKTITDLTPVPTRYKKLLEAYIVNHEITFADIEKICFNVIDTQARAGEVKTTRVPTSRTTPAQKHRMLLRNEEDRLWLAKLARYRAEEGLTLNDVQAQWFEYIISGRESSEEHNIDDVPF